MKMSGYPVWNKENTYKKYDVVQYIGALYAALSDVTSGVEINDTSKWLMIYKNGALTNHERYQGLLIEQASESGGGGGGGETELTYLVARNYGQGYSSEEFIEPQGTYEFDLWMYEPIVQAGERLISAHMYEIYDIDPVTHLRTDYLPIICEVITPTVPNTYHVKLFNPTLERLRFAQMYFTFLIEKTTKIKGGGGGGGSSYTAGDGIDITNDEISVNNTIARQTTVTELQGQVTAQYNTIEQMRTDLGGLSHELSALTQDVGVIAGRIFIAEYGVTTAEEILAFLEYTNEPFAPMFVKRSGSFYTVVTAAKQGDDRVIIRTMGTLSGAYYVFVYDITGSVWTTNNYAFQQELVSGTSIKTINGESLLGAGDIPISGGTVDQTFDATSTNAQSGTAVDEALKGFFSVKGANNDNITVAAGARVNTTIQVVSVNESAQIASYKRVFINNATDGGMNRDKIALQSMSTGGGGKQANIAVINTGSTDAKIKVEVECLCMNTAI